MAVSSHHAFLAATASLTSSRHQPKSLASRPVLLPCRCSLKPNPDPGNLTPDGSKLAKLALVALAAGVLTLGSADDALAAKSGGRVGGQAFRSAAPRASSPRSNNSRTNIYINPPVAPPLIGGYGYGSPFYGGWGWSPFSFFVPGPSVAIGVGGGFDFFIAFLVLGAITTVVRRIAARRDEDDDY